MCAPPTKICEARVEALVDSEAQVILHSILLVALHCALFFVTGCRSGAPARTRTWDQLIKSQLLYQLSYRGTQGAQKIGKSAVFVNSVFGDPGAVGRRRAAHLIVSCLRPCERVLPGSVDR